MRSLTTQQERSFEKAHILKERESYLQTDVLVKVQTDEGYRAKVNQLEHALRGETDVVLDIGSNTCGECEYLASKGYTVIATDVNEQALMISATRAMYFGRPLPRYVACDGQLLPFRSESIGCVVFYESLHHMPSPSAALEEACRVLEPGGRVILCEPCAYDPWRRLSEIRDYFTGTIEKSFSVSALTKLLQEARLEVTSLQRPILAPSTWKLGQLSHYRRWRRLFYYRIRRALPGIFGALFLIARKPCDRSTRPSDGGPPGRHMNIASAHT